MFVSHWQLFHDVITCTPLLDPHPPFGPPALSPPYLLKRISKCFTCPNYSYTPFNLFLAKKDLLCASILCHSIIGYCIYDNVMIFFIQNFNFHKKSLKITFSRYKKCGIIVKKLWRRSFLAVSFCFNKTEQKLVELKPFICWKHLLWVPAPAQ